MPIFQIILVLPCFRPFITHDAGEECEGNVFSSVCVSVDARNSKTITPIDLIFQNKKSYTRGSDLF